MSQTGTLPPTFRSERELRAWAAKEAGPPFLAQRRILRFDTSKDRKEKTGLWVVLLQGGSGLYVTTVYLFSETPYFISERDKGTVYVLQGCFFQSEVGPLAAAFDRKTRQLVLTVEEPGNPKPKPLREVLRYTIPG